MKNALKRSMILVILMIAAVTQTAEANDDLNNMVEVRASGAEQQSEAAAMIDRLSNIDDRILYEANRSGAKIILMDEPLTDLPEFAHLSGIVPRGWESNGNTWDAVPGAGGFITAARIGYSNPGNGHSTSNLELHEFGHAVDSYVAGFTISESAEFRDIMSREKNTLFSDHEVPEYFDVPSEYFAEVFGMYNLGGAKRDELQSRAPETYRFISTLHNRLISFSEVTGNTMTVTWDDVDGAASYNIYQDGEKTAEVDSGTESYTAEDLDVSTTYEFYVEPVDASGNSILTSYFRYATTSAEEDPDQIDREALQSTFEEAKTLDETFEDTDLKTLIEEAEALLEQSSSDLTQAEVNDMNEALMSAIENAETARDEAEQAETQETESAEDTEETEEAEDTEGTENSQSGGSDTGSESESSEEGTASEDESASDGENSEDNESAGDDSESDSVSGDTDTESSTAANTGDNTIWFIAAGLLIILAVGSFLYMFIRRK